MGFWCSLALLAHISFFKFLFLLLLVGYIFFVLYISVAFLVHLRLRLLHRHLLRVPVLCWRRQNQHRWEMMPNFLPTDRVRREGQRGGQDQHDKAGGSEARTLVTHDLVLPCRGGRAPTSPRSRLMGTITTTLLTPWPFY